MEEYPSGQRGQTVNLLASPSMVRIHPPPPRRGKVRPVQVSHPSGGRLSLCSLAPPLPARPEERLCGGPMESGLVGNFLLPSATRCAGLTDGVPPFGRGFRASPGFLIFLQRAAGLVLLHSFPLLLPLPSSFCLCSKTVVRVRPLLYHPPPPKSRAAGGIFFAIFLKYPEKRDTLSGRGCTPPLRRQVFPGIFTFPVDAGPVRVVY